MIHESPYYGVCGKCAQLRLENADSLTIQVGNLIFGMTSGRVSTIRYHAHFASTDGHKWQERFKRFSRSVTVHESSYCGECGNWEVCTISVGSDR